MKNDPPTVSVIIPAKNEARFIGDCLRSLENQLYPKENFEVLVVNNQSTDNTREVASDFQVSVYDCDSSRIGAVRNFGVSRSSGHFLAFLDADCIADPNWLMEAVSYITKYSDVGAVGGDALGRENGTWLERFWFFRNARTTQVMSTLNGASMFLSRNVFEKVGGFNEDINAGEDTKLADDIKEHGLALHWQPSADVIHLGYPRTARDFFKRQFWLASSYLTSNLGFSDRMFLLTVLFLLSTISLAVGLIARQPLIGWLSFGGLLTAPILFSIKKVYGSRVKPVLVQVTVVFSFSVVYFLARSAGLIYSVTGKKFERSKL